MAELERQALDDPFINWCEAWDLDPEDPESRCEYDAMLQAALEDEAERRATEDHDL